jgi:hypothetical protein
MRQRHQTPFKTHPLWWLGQVGLILVASLFLVFGVQLLIAAYELPDPFSFIMTFFAASLIILISLALLAGFLLRLHSVYRYLKTPPPPPDTSAPVEASTGVDASKALEAPSGDGERPAESPERSRR